MEDPLCIHREALLILHDKSLTLFGIACGIRDTGRLDSALMRPRNKFVYEPGTAIHRLAAAYCFEIARNHPFVDGNKRSALTAMGLFPELGGYALDASPMMVEQTVLALVAGDMDEDSLGAWLSGHSIPV